MCCLTLCMQAFTSCRVSGRAVPEPVETGSVARAPVDASASATAPIIAPASATPRVPIARARVESRPDVPCRGCDTRLPPTNDIEAPASLLVVMHGDLGDVSRMTRVWQKAALDRGMILTSLLCPRDKGCNNSWWKWYLSPQHDPQWLGEQIDALSRQVPIDASRVYVAGYSGGASYLGYYAPTHPERFAAVAHIAGGVQFTGTCSPRKTPVMFLIGNQDPMLSLYVNRLHAWYQQCGNPISWRVLPGVTHDGIVPLLQAGRAGEVVDWMRQARPEEPAQ